MSELDPTAPGADETGHRTVHHADVADLAVTGAGPEEAAELDDDRRVDAALDALDDGSALVSAGATSEEHEEHEERDDHGGVGDLDDVVRGATDVPGSDALPLALAVRDHFAVVGEVEATGDPRVDAATARLAEVPDLATADHVEVYEDVHRRLQDALADAEVR